ncbi:MAG: Radical domain protein [Deltaproteobacteria bacterium]|nr:Radical domain protein [Deltaproteobacteria bacterium]
MVIQKILSAIAPTFDWIQVEVTSACNAACIYCPRTVYRDVWEDRHLPLDAFRKLEPAFAKSRHVHLQGWGEPLLHPDFFDMVAIAKAAGWWVGTTTNGMLLNRDRITRSIESGLDIVAFSLAGTTERNDVIRKGTSLKKVLEAIQALDRAKKEMGRLTPEIHVAYMLFRSGMGELEALPALLEGLGVSQVVVSTLDFVATDELRKEVVIPATQEEFEKTRLALEHLVEVGREKGLSVHYHLISPEKRRDVCTENVQRALCRSVQRSGEIKKQSLAAPPFSICIILALTWGRSCLLVSPRFGRSANRRTKQILFCGPFLISVLFRFSVPARRSQSSRHGRPSADRFPSVCL